MSEGLDLEYFRENGFRRVRCGGCGSYFWSLGEHTVCGESPCAEYAFIDEPMFSKRLDMGEMRELYLRFFEARGHTRVGRYPLVARWRDDTFFTNASIYAFQPWVTEGVMDPPANPLVISQPCVRFNDIDNVGRTGRHLSMFEMMAHHAFNGRGSEIYFKERTVELCHELLTKELGTRPESVKYKEEWWEGGGNSGPSLSVGVQGIELATLVFMQYSGPDRVPMDIRVVDTGYGLERFTWASQCTPNVYEAAFPRVIESLRSALGVPPPDPEVMRAHSRFAGMLDMETQGDLRRLRERLGRRVGIDPEALEAMLAPHESIYAIADHMRAAVFLVNDGVIPSNAKAGYFLRLIIRRAMRCLDALEGELELSEVAGWHLSSLGDALPPENRDGILQIISIEAGKYRSTLERGARIVRKMAAERGRIDEEDLIRLYDSHGLTPDLVRSVAPCDVQVPDDFFTRVAMRHERAERPLEEGTVPPSNVVTEMLAHDLNAERLWEGEAFTFPADIVEVLPGKAGAVWLVLDRTYFYPEGGGQESDRGRVVVDLDGERVELDVVDVQVSGRAALHGVRVDASEGGDDIRERLTGAIRRSGSLPVECSLDVKRRLALMRHHTAVHVVNGCARSVLGAHVWQAGAHKSERSARLDITHYAPLNERTLDDIERMANEVVMMDIPLRKSVSDRMDAERRHGFKIYQGGFIPGKVLRITEIPGLDVEACGGTHCERTGEIGLIKITGSRRIQDGVVRIELVAGTAAFDHVRRMEDTLRAISGAMKVPLSSLEAAVENLVRERRRLEKEVARSAAEGVDAVVEAMLKGALTLASGVRLLFSSGEHDAVLIDAISRKVASMKGVVAVLNPAGASTVYVTRGKGVPLDAERVLRGILAVTGGNGGGSPAFARGRASDISQLRSAAESVLLGG